MKSDEPKAPVVDEPVIDEPTAEEETHVDTTDESTDSDTVETEESTEVEETSEPYSDPEPALLNEQIGWKTAMDNHANVFVAENPDWESQID